MSTEVACYLFALTLCVTNAYSSRNIDEGQYRLALAEIVNLKREVCR